MESTVFSAPKWNPVSVLQWTQQCAVLFTHCTLPAHSRTSLNPSPILPCSVLIRLSPKPGQQEWQWQKQPQCNCRATWTLQDCLGTHDHTYFWVQHLWEWGGRHHWALLCVCPSLHLHLLFLRLLHPAYSYIFVCISLSLSALESFSCFCRRPEQSCHIYCHQYI